jgi:hypothetical protein
MSYELSRGGARRGFRGSPVVAVQRSNAMIRALTIFSGGQAGVDRGALDAALELGNPCGGWCPRGRSAEDGPIPPRYPLHETVGGYAERTRRNIAESDGTLILHRGPLSDGTLLTLEICRELGKPVRMVDAGTSSPSMAAIDAMQFIEAHDIERLNVAGPRESHWTHAYDYAFDAVHSLIVMLWHDEHGTS